MRPRTRPPLGCATRLVAAGVVVIACAAFGPAGRPALEEAERCWRLISLFDEIVQTPLDAHLLQVDRTDFEEARAWRHRAEAHCAAGRTWFGIGLIEDAFREIGVSPRLGEAAPPHE